MVWSIFSEQGKTAVFTPATENGKYDYNTARYAPVRNPLAHLDRIQFHSDLAYMEVAFRGTRSISHPSRAHTGYNSNGGSSGGSGTPQPSTWRAEPATATHVLYNHNLGYRPHVIVKVGNAVLTAGYPIQRAGNNGIRVVSVRVTNTQVLLEEAVWTWGGTLSGTSETYEIVGFAKSNPVPSAKVVRTEPGKVTIGRAIVDSQRRYMRRGLAGEDRFFAPTGRTADARYGTVRFASPDGMVRDDSNTDYTGSFGPSDVDAVPLSIADTRETPAITKTWVDETGRFRMIDDGHVVFDSDRPLAKIVQSIDLSGEHFNFPNPPQDWLVWADSRTVYSSGGNFTFWGQGVWKTVRPQEWSDTIELATIDVAGANFFLCHARGAQTISPNNIGGNAGSISISSSSGPKTVNAPITGRREIPKFIPENQWLQVNGTIVLEATYMFRRTLSFEIVGNKLRARLQQSIGGYNTNGYRGDMGVEVLGMRDNSATNIEVVMRNEYLTGSRDRLGPPSVPSRNWSSRWTFDLEFQIGHV